MTAGSYAIHASRHVVAHKLVIIPAVALVCAAEIGRRCLWMAYPVATTFYGIVTGRRPTANDEDDWIG